MKPVGGSKRCQLLLVGILAVATACSEEASPRAPRLPEEPAPTLAGDGVVVVPELAEHRSVLGLEAAAEADTPFLHGHQPASVTVVAPDGEGPSSDAAATVSTFRRDEQYAFEDLMDAPPTTSGGRAAFLVDWSADRPYSGARCGSRSLFVDLGHGWMAVVASVGAGDGALHDIAAGVTAAAASEPELEVPSGWSELGRLDGGWRTGGDGSVTRLDDSLSTRVLARRIHGTERAVLDALRCADPAADLVTDPTIGSPDVGGQAPRTVGTALGPATIGMVGISELAVAVADRLLLVEYGDRVPFTDAQLVQLVEGMRIEPLADFAARVAQLEAATGERALAALRPNLPAGASVVASGELEGQGWVLALVPDQGGAAAGPSLCGWAAVAGYAEQFDPMPLACLRPDRLAGDVTMTVQADPVGGPLVYAAVPAATGSVVVEAPGEPPAEVVLVHAGPPFGVVAVAIVRIAPMGFGATADAVTLHFDDPAAGVVVTAYDDGGGVLGRRVLRGDCPAPPGCPA